jgi:hypothetical protein
MLTITNTAVRRAQVWAAFRRTPDVRLRARYHGLMRLMEGRSGPEGAPWRDRDEETVRAGVHAFTDAGRPGLKRASIPGRPA